MKRFHLLFGLTILVVFLLTGQYMDRRLDHLMYMSDGPRMLFRTRHIYILLAGLLNVSLGSYLAYRPERWRKTVRLVGSVLIVAATLLFVFAFFFEPTLADLKTPVTLLAMIAISTGTLLHLFSTLRIKDAGVGIMTVIAILLGLTIAQASYRVVAQDPLDGPGPSFQDPLMDNLVGEWRLSREIRGRTVRTPSR